jgi:putative heme iron utilization protein
MTTAMPSFVWSFPFSTCRYCRRRSLVELRTRQICVRGRVARINPAILWLQCVDAEKTAQPQTEESFSQVKQLLESTKKLGKLRIIVTNDACVMESICTTEKLFYAQGPNQALYANLIDTSLNLDLHIKLEAIGAVRFEQGVSRTPSKDPTYIIRWLGKDHTTVVLSMFLQWDKEPRDISSERIEEWKKLKEEYCQNSPT